MSADSLSKPAESRAVVVWEEGGLTLVLPPVGFRALGMSWLGCLTVGAVLTALSVVASLRLVRSPHFLEQLFWVVFLGYTTLILRPLLLEGVRYLLDESLGRATLVATQSGLYVHRRGMFRARECVWDRADLDALDEDAGELCLLVNGESVTLLDRRSVAELRWIAGLLRRMLDVPAEPPAGDGVRVRCKPSRKDYSWRGVLRARPGFLEIRSLLRPGDDLHFVAGERSARKRFRDPLTPVLTPESITWLPGTADKPTLQIHFVIQTSCCLLIDSDDPDALRAALTRFWEPASVAADSPLPVLRDAEGSA